MRKESKKEIVNKLVYFYLMRDQRLLEDTEEPIKDLEAKLLDILLKERNEENKKA
jgi:hypothetical protein